MDPNGHIYEGEHIPPEDKARLEGYLRGRAEEGAKERALEREAQLERLLAEAGPPHGHRSEGEAHGELLHPFDGPKD